MESALWGRYRAVGLVSSAVTPAVQALGKEHFLTTAVGRSFHTYNVRVRRGMGHTGGGSGGRGLTPGAAAVPQADAGGCGWVSPFPPARVQQRSTWCAARALTPWHVHQAHGTRRWSCW